MISIQNLTRKYGDVVAVRDVSLEIRRGEIVGLLGHNGAGKTTMMKVITGYLEPTAGDVTVDGLDVVAHRNEAQQKLGYLPESAPLYPEMLVHEYLRLIGELRRMRHERIDQAIADAAFQTGLTDHLESPIATLSKGYRQRVGLAQAILHKPDVLVLDEPTNGLDPVQIQSIRDLIQRLGKTTTIILSTHILQEVEAVCDRVLVMINGRLVADSPLAELLHSDTIRLCVARGADVRRIAGTVDGVSKVERVGPADRDGFEWWSITPAGGANPTAEILQAGMKAGWTIDAIGHENLTLDTVYQRIQQAHVAQVEAA